MEQHGQIDPAEAQRWKDGIFALFLDTLALAYHRTGQNERAIETQRKALTLLPEDDKHNRAEFERQLTEFEAALKGKE